MINIGEISQSGNSVTPAKAKRSTTVTATESIEKVNRSTAETKQKNARHKKTNKSKKHQALNREAKASHSVYDKKGHRHVSSQIDFII